MAGGENRHQLLQRTDVDWRYSASSLFFFSVGSFETQRKSCKVARAALIADLRRGGGRSGLTRAKVRGLFSGRSSGSADLDDGDVKPGRTRGVAGSLRGTDRSRPDVRLIPGLLLVEMRLICGIALQVWRSSGLIVQTYRPGALRF